MVFIVVVDGMIGGQSIENPHATHTNTIQSPRSQEHTMVSQGGQPFDDNDARRNAPSPHDHHHHQHPAPVPARQVLTFDPTYPQAQHVPRGIGISRFSEDDAFEQNDRKRSVGSGSGGGGGGGGGSDGEDDDRDESDDGQDVAFESVDLDGGEVSGHLSSDFAQSLRLSSPSAVGLTPTGHTLQRSSFAYGSHPDDEYRHSEDGARLQRPVSENGHASNSSARSFFSRSSTPKPTPRDDPDGSDSTSPVPTIGRRTPDPSTSTRSPTQTRPRIHAPPAIPHSLNPSVMAALTSNQYPTQAASSSPQSTTLPSKSSSSAFSLLKRNSLSLTGRGAKAGSGKGKGNGSGTLDQVRSRTRMVHLPPKDKEEDEAHLESWKHMMEESRSAGKCPPSSESVEVDPYSSTGRRV